MAGNDVLGRLRSELGRRVLAPGDEGFDRTASMVFAGDDRRPIAVARPRDEREVAAVVTVAAETSTPLGVRGGGHGYARHALVDGGIVLDTRALAGVHIDAAHRVGVAGGGTTAGAYTTAAAEHGLATGFGDTAGVGIAGLALGGGIGYLSRRDGLTVDNVLGATVVLADGRVVEASDDEEPELFWALRGGGGNFGVVTSLRLRLHETPVVTGGMLAFEARGATVAALVRAARDADDALSLMVNVMKAPPAPFLPAEHQGRPIVVALVCHSGRPEQAERALAPFRASGPVLADLIRVQPYPAMFQAGPELSGNRAAVRTGFADGFDATRAELAVALVGEAPTPLAVVNLRPMGGAIARVAEDATAFAHRSRAIMTAVSALHPDPAMAASGAEWTARASAALDIGGPGYVNFVTASGDAAARAAYPEATLRRLAEVKRRYDPANVFSSNVNVEPAEVAVGR
ncbi:FAD-binding oxidoreductase [Agromyces sp. H66]|uniref:FAD-binding oxidoreductase n=1 Tax=Agromyces sp. H66 TaxID=2529859 RepID=UPI0010AA1208|nr:FAD-binding oxidoreductase [Agromyces sp. H66]